MKAFLISIRKNPCRRFSFPAACFVILVIVTKAWNMLTGVGQKIAGLFGLQTIASIATNSLITTLILLLILLLSGLLVRLTFVGNFRNILEENFLKYIPGYVNYKNSILEKIDKKTSAPKKPAWVKMSGHLQPALLVENNENGNCIIYVTASPSTAIGQVFLVKTNDIMELNVPEQTLNRCLQNMGKGLLGLQEQIGKVNSH